MHSKQVEQFLKKHGLKHITSVVGGFVERDENQVREIFKDFFATLNRYPIAIITGGTEWNVPGLATRIAKDYGMKVIGVLPETGREDMEQGLDLEIVVPPATGTSHYGDETQVLVKLSHAIVSLGGGPGVGIEVSQAMKINLDREYSGTEPIHIVPIKGFGGETDMYIKTDPPYFPNISFTDGTSAAEYVLKKMEYRESKFIKTRNC